MSAWTDRIWREYRAGNITRSYRDVLLTLHSYRGKGGRCWPAYATIAERAVCGIRTVARAIQHARLLGLLDWQERRRQSGWRLVRSSNWYQFLQPNQPVASGMRPIWPSRRTECQPGAVVPEKEKQDALGRWLAAAEAMPDLLAARRQQQQAAARSALVSMAGSLRWK
jgi:hypothetical protein